MALSIDDLTTPMSVDDVRQSIYSIIALTGVDVTNWKPGAIVRTIISAVAIVIAAMSNISALSTKSGFLALSSGDWLTLVAHYVYGVDRILASTASGTLTLTNTSGGVYVVAAGDLIVSSSSTGKLYHNTAGFTLNAVSSLTIAITALEPGSASTAFIGEIDTLQTSLTGVTCSNPVALVGTDDEDDAALRARCSEKLGSLSPFGPSDAYAFAARSALRLDGTPVGITRVRTTKDTAGNVDVYVATPSGAVSGTVTDTSSDLGAVNDAIQKNAAPLGITANVHTAVPVTIPITYELWMYNTSGLSEAQITSQIASKLAALFANEALGGDVINVLPGKLYQDTIEFAISSAVPGIFRVVLSAPASDVSLNVSDVTILGAITVTAIHQVPQPGQ